MDSKQEDEILISHILDGDEKSFEILTKKYTSRVNSVISQYVYNVNDRDDVSQEVFINVYKNLDKFRGDSSFYTWLFRITSNVSKNYLKKKNRNLPEVSYAAEDSKIVMSDNNTPEKIYISRESLKLLNEELNKLPGAMKDAIILRYKKGLEYKEIAREKNCPVGTAKSRVFRAREVLRNYIKNEK